MLLFHARKEKKTLDFLLKAFLDFLGAYFEKRNDPLKILSLLGSVLTETIL